MSDPTRLYVVGCLALTIVFCLTHLLLGAYERHAARKLRRRPRS